MKWVIGIDEVGRGPLAGPVYVCAVAMPLAAYRKAQWKLQKPYDKVELKDSKRMNPKNRELWYLETEFLSKKGKVRYAVSSRSAKDIDKKGITVCIRECIAENLKKLKMERSKSQDCTVLLDGGLKAPEAYKKQRTIIRGDGSEKIIALASVVAKVERDHYMIALHPKHPSYDWLHNKGYGTTKHISSIKNKGLTSFHRKSFLKKILDK